MADAGIEFTTEEILVLVEQTDLRPPSGLGIDSFDDFPDAYRDYARETATRTLTARGVLSADTPPVVNSAVRTLLAAAAEPALLAICSTENDGVVETTFHTVTPDLGVTHACPSPSLHRLTPFPPRELMSRVLRAADLRPSPQPDAEDFTVTVDALEMAADQIEDGDHTRAVDTLTQAGASEASAEAFCSSMVAKVGSANVSILHKPTADTVEGGSLAWLDTGLSGLWVTEPSDEGSGEEPTKLVSVQPYSGDRVGKELLSYLPSAFAGPDSDPE